MVSVGGVALGEILTQVWCGRRRDGWWCAVIRTHGACMVVRGGDMHWVDYVGTVFWDVRAKRRGGGWWGRSCHDKHGTT